MCSHHLIVVVTVSYKKFSISQTAFFIEFFATEYSVDSLCNKLAAGT